jgi:hypothetical protein
MIKKNHDLLPRGRAKGHASLSSSFAERKTDIMLRFTSVLLSCILSLVSVAYSQTDENFARRKAIDEFVDNGIALPINTSLAGIQALGKVNKVEVVSYDAPHDKGLVLEMRTFYFDGLQVVAHFVKGDESRAQLSKTVVTGTQWKVNKGLTVGTSIDTLVKTLGEPTTKKAQSYEYCGETECVIFDLTKNRVSKITFAYYLD